jgi:hypothetical protein
MQKQNAIPQQDPDPEAHLPESNSPSPSAKTDSSPVVDSPTSPESPDGPPASIPASGTNKRAPSAEGPSPQKQQKPPHNELLGSSSVSETESTDYSMGEVDMSSIDSLTEAGQIRLQMLWRTGKEAETKPPFASLPKDESHKPC